VGAANQAALNTLGGYPQGTAAAPQISYPVDWGR
jgi:hypothetical protein